MHQPYDKASKWLIQHYGDAILRIGGVTNLVSWKPIQAELVQPGQLPDGLIEAQLAGEPKPRPFILELATYPEERLHDQLTRDMLMVLLDRGVLPDALALVLHPRGRLQIRDHCELISSCGWGRMTL